MFAFQDYGVEPGCDDNSKSAGLRCPGWSICPESKRLQKSSLENGDHGTTYGGNPLPVQRSARFSDLFESEKILEHVKKYPHTWKRSWMHLTQKYDFTARRGKGLMQGIVVTGRPVGEIVTKSIENGLMVISAGSDVLRLVPPLVITERDVDEMIEN